MRRLDAICRDILQDAAVRMAKRNRRALRRKVLDAAAVAADEAAVRSERERLPAARAGQRVGCEDG